MTTTDFMPVSRETSVVALMLENSQMRVHHCPVSAMSASGARIHSTNQLGSGDLYLLMPFDGTQRRYLRAAIVNEQPDERSRIPERRKAHRFMYEVRLLGFVIDSELLDLFQCLAPESESGDVINSGIS